MSNSPNKPPPPASPRRQPARKTGSRRPEPPCPPRMPSERPISAHTKPPPTPWLQQLAPPHRPKLSRFPRLDLFPPFSLLSPIQLHGCGQASRFGIWTLGFPCPESFRGWCLKVWSFVLAPTL